MGCPLIPDIVADSLTDITIAFLRQKDIKLLMLDFDNTIVPYTTDVPTPEMDAWLRAVQASGIRLCVLSNSHKSRVPDFCRRYGIDCRTHARKPFRKGIRACIAHYGLPLRQCALAGDQIYTDVLCARRSGVYSILVRSIHNHTFWLKLRHAAELPFIYAGRKRRVDYEKH